ncbi:MAG: RsmE family RNA methyltransferase, partial [Planctomycetota bacterium]
MRVPRVVVPGVEAAGSTLCLPPAEAIHVAIVLRRRPGDRLVLVSEAGAAYEAEIVSVERARSGVRVEVSLIGPPPEPMPPLVPWTVAAAPGRGERFEIAVEAAGELGLARLILVETERSVLRLKEGSPKLARWRRIARESAKQSGRAPPLAIDGPVGLDDLLARWRSIAGEGLRESGG